jgi:hypothetical protein
LLIFRELHEEASMLDIGYKLSSEEKVKTAA